MQLSVTATLPSRLRRSVWPRPWSGFDFGLYGCAYPGLCRCDRWVLLKKVGYSLSGASAMSMAISITLVKVGPVMSSAPASFSAS